MEKDKKLRPMKIWEILRRETDEDHPMGTETLRERLKESGYPCTRKTLYGDIALLNDNGYEVMALFSSVLVLAAVHEYVLRL